MIFATTTRRISVGSTLISTAKNDFGRCLVT